MFFLLLTNLEWHSYSLFSCYIALARATSPVHEPSYFLA